MIRTTEIDGSEGTYHPTNVLPDTYTFEQLETTYKNLKNNILNKKSTYDHIVLEEYRTNVEISSNISHIRLATYELGKRWEYSEDGTNWTPVNGREIAFHYSRENRDNIKLIKNEDTNPADMLENVQFRLERSFPTAGSYSLYTNGTGKGRGSVTDTGTNGIYTTDSNGEFIMNLPEGYYKLTEIQAASGYELLTAPVTFHVGVTAIPDISENERKSPYSVDPVSANATYMGNDYNTWNTEKIFGAMTVSNVRQVPLHILVQKGVGEYELADTLRTTEYVTAALGNETTIANALNPAPTGYVNYHIYYGSENPSGTFNLETDADVSKLTGTGNGIIVNETAGKVLSKDQAVYFILYKEPRTVPYHILLNENGTITDKSSEWATADTTTERTTSEFTVRNTGVNVAEAYPPVKIDGTKSYRLAKVVYASSQPTSTSAGTELKWLVNKPDAVEARKANNTDTTDRIGDLSSNDAVYFIYNAGYDLRISKTVDGQMGDQTKSFTVYLDSPAMTESSYRDENNIAHNTATVGSTKRITLSLKHGESITLKELPEGSYTITEEDPGSSYTVTCKYKIGNGNEVTSGPKPIAEASLTFTLSDDTTVIVTNKLDAVSPTGISFMYAPYILMLLCGAALVLLIRKKRNA